MEPIRGFAAGVPFVAVPPAAGGSAPLVVIWHLMDSPRTEVAMAAALPLADVPAWRVYLGLPLAGARTPAGGFDEIMALATEDALLNFLGASIAQAAAEFGSVLDALREQLPDTALVDAPVSLVGGSAGGGAALLTLTESERPIAAAVPINAAIRATSVVALTERAFGVEYRWSEESRRLADRLDFVARAGEIAARRPQASMLIVSGEADHEDFQADAAALRDALAERYADPAGVALVTIPDLAHPLAEEPGLEAAPQTPQAKAVDAVVSKFLTARLAEPAAQP
jgi:pimeloyl-ACP methyl ester carboxylesterase